MRLGWFDRLLWPIAIKIHASCKSSDANFLICFNFAEELRIRRYRIHDEDLTFATGNKEHISINIVNHSFQTVGGAQILAKKEFPTLSLCIIQISHN